MRRQRVRAPEAPHLGLLAAAGERHVFGQLWGNIGGAIRTAEPPAS